MTLKYGYSNADICDSFFAPVMLPKSRGFTPGSIPRYSLTNHYENSHFFEKFEKFESASDGLPICRKVMPIDSGFASGFSKNSKKRPAFEVLKMRAHFEKNAPSQPLKARAYAPFTFDFEKRVCRGSTK